MQRYQAQTSCPHGHLIQEVIHRQKLFITSNAQRNGAADLFFNENVILMASCMRPDLPG